MEESKPPAVSTNTWLNGSTLLAAIGVSRTAENTETYCCPCTCNIITSIQIFAFISTLSDLAYRLNLEVLTAILITIASNSNNKHVSCTVLQISMEIGYVNIIKAYLTDDVC
jgi:hypothetical protein